MDSHAQAVINPGRISPFHTATGLVNPTGATLQVSLRPEDLGASSGLSVAYSATLLHEQHHWLQQLGTPAGVFNLLLLETQTSYVISTVDLAGLSGADVPIAMSARMSPEHIDVWSRLEATRLLFFGGRSDDLRRMQEFGHPPLVGMLDDLLWPMVRRTPTSPVTTRDADGPLRAWAAEHGASGVPEGTTQGRYLVGASHLMEGAARAGELIFSSYGRSGPLDPAWLVENLAGAYRVVWDMLVAGREPSAGLVAQLLYICDLGLCGALPPAFPPSGPFMHPGWAPGKHASIIIELLGHRAPPDVDFAEPGSVRAAFASFDEQLAGAGVVELRDVTLARLREVLGGYEVAAEADRAFRMVDDMPAPHRDGSRYRFILALAHEVLRLRESDPLFVMAPFVLARTDPAGYVDQFATIAPPLIDPDGRGFVATHPRPGWTEYFVMGAVEYELVRALMTRTVEETVALLAPHTHTRAGVEHGAGWVAAGLHHTLRGSPLAASMSRDVWYRTVGADADGSPNPS